MGEFDDKARTWDDNPAKRKNAEAVAARIREIVPVSEDWAAFEYGCGTGLLSFALQPYLGNITLADNSESMLEVLREKIALFRKTLKKREKEIFDQRIFSDTPVTLQQIGDRHGISRERVRQVENAVLKKLRGFLEKEIPDFASFKGGFEPDANRPY